MSTCSLALSEMASSGVHQRKVPQKNQDDSSGTSRERDSEPGVLQGLLPCIVGVAGISLLIWLLFFLYIPPSIIKGNSLCTRLSNPESFTRELGAITDWQSFARELGVSSKEIENVGNSEGSQVEKVGQILKLWSEKSGVPCLEKLVNTLKKLGETTLADSLVKNFEPTNKT